MRFLRWILGLVVWALVYNQGRASPGWPPVAHPAHLGTWWATRGSLVAVFAIARCAVLAAGGYWLMLLAITQIVVATGAVGLLHRLHRRPILGTGLALRVVLGSSAAGALLSACGGNPLAGTTGNGTSNSAPPTIQAPTLANLGPWPATGPAGGGPAATGPAATGPAATRPFQPVSRLPVTRRAPAGRWATRVVQPGDSLWSIAVATVKARSGSDTDVGAYWLALIAANREHLPDPEDPSLLFAGDTVTLPPLPLASGPD